MKPQARVLFVDVPYLGLFRLWGQVWRKENFHDIRPVRDEKVGEAQLRGFHYDTEVEVLS